MPSHRCSICNVEWPMTAAFKTCPQCGEPTFVNPKGKSHVSHKKSDRLTNPEIDRIVRKFRSWLNTVTADDFRLHE